MSTHAKHAVIGTIRGRPAHPERQTRVSQPTMLAPKPTPPESSWWLCDDATFAVRARQEARRMLSTSMKPATFVDGWMRKKTDD